MIKMQVKKPTAGGVQDGSRENTKEFWRKKRNKETRQVLVVIEGPDKGREFILLPCRMNIGRHVDNYIRLSDPQVSRKHAVLEFDAERHKYMLTDLKSTNGTYLNNQRINSGFLTPGDRIRAGGSILEVVAPKDRNAAVEPCRG